MNRTAGPLPLIAAFAAGIVAIGLGWLASGWASPDAPAGPTEAAVPERPAKAVSFTVEYVYDGDTLRMHVADAEASATPLRVRIIGVDAPEGTPTVACGADAARAHLRALLPEGATVWVVPGRDPGDRYSRLLGDLWTDDGRFIAYELAAAGSARALRIPPNDRHADVLADAEAAARAAGAGLWSDCP